MDERGDHNQNSQTPELDIQALQGRFVLVEPLFDAGIPEVTFGLVLFELAEDFFDAHLDLTKPYKTNILRRTYLLRCRRSAAP